MNQLTEGSLYSRKGDNEMPKTHRRTEGWAPCKPVDMSMPDKSWCVAFAGPWIGEFGWEIMTWVPYLRKLSREYDKMYISTFESVEALYMGFHCDVEFLPHRNQTRTDTWEDGQMQAITTCTDNQGATIQITDHIRPVKEYRIEGEYVRYGSPVVKNVAVLFHARGIEKGAYKNWPQEKWEVLAKAFPGARSIGSGSDLIVKGTMQSPAGDLATLMNIIASASVVIGGSSGVMHLALMCGTPVVTWGDCNNFGDTLENRYKVTWNPFNTPVTWIDNTWDPEPEQILDALSRKSAPDPKTLQIVKAAVESQHYMIAVAYMGEKDGKEALYAQAGGTDFPDRWLDKAERDVITKIKQSISRARAERIPVSWR